MLEYAVKTEIGNRKINEDYVTVANNNGQYCFVLCDGLGGHGMGDIASKFVAEQFAQALQNCTNSKTFLKEAFELAQQKLIDYQNEKQIVNKMRTTAAVLNTDTKKAYIGYIGDSRVYVFDAKGEKFRTLDHSVPQMLALSGKIEDSEIRTHTDRNILLRAMGTNWEKPMYELEKPISLSKCKAFLLCSDGLWEHIKGDTMSQLLENADNAQSWLDSIYDTVLKNSKGKSMDNFSAIAIINKSYK